MNNLIQCRKKLSFIRTAPFLSLIHISVIFGKALAKVYSLASNPTVSYADKDKVATTSVPYLELLNRLNIMVGDSNNNFNPKVNINRAEMSVLVTKAYNTLKGNTNTNTNTPSGCLLYTSRCV